MPDKSALVDLAGDRSLTYSALDTAVDRLAAWLVQQFGERSGERIAAHGKNCIEIVVLHLAAIRAGCIFLPLNWRLSPSEIAVIVADAGPAMMFQGEGTRVHNFAGRMYELDDVFALGAEGEKPPRSASCAFDDISCLLYTSGTSGTPKGVMLSEGNSFWGGMNFILSNGVSPASRFLCDMPLFHTAGLHSSCRTPLMAGATVYISAGFDPELTLARLADPALGITHYFSVPQMAATLLQTGRLDAPKLAHLEVWTVGGASMPPDMARKFAKDGIPVVNGFGMSEVSSAFGMPAGRPEVLIEKAGSCGLKFASIEARLLGRSGEDVPVGEAGNLMLRGPSVTRGYWNQPELTAKAFTDGWFETGDVARCDGDGFYTILDRTKDMYISGGENVYPAEVEAVLLEMPQVLECAVVGRADERWGEVGTAFVTTSGAADVSERDILAYCASRLAKFKVPKSVVFTNDIPRTASGKIQKHLLRERAEQKLGRAI